MRLSSDPAAELLYCLNVFPDASPDGFTRDILPGLERIKQNLSPGQPMGLGLRFSEDQLMELEDQFTTRMEMVLRTTFKELEKSSIDSIFQTTSSQPKTSITLNMETSQATLERPNMKEGQTTNHHTSTLNSVTVDSEPTLVSSQEVMELMRMSSTKTDLLKLEYQKSTKRVISH